MPAKNIVICCDGTGNEFVDADPNDPKCTGANSNVVKFYTAATIDNLQAGYYHPGVGTMGDSQARTRLGKSWSRLKGLGIASGFMDNVEDAYRYLMATYDDGDQIYLFGFSRGAYTARALAAILHGYGLLCKGNEGHIPYLLRMFTDDMNAARKENRQHRKKRETTGKAKATKTSLTVHHAFKQTFSHDVTLRFVGLWDTVSAVGWFYQPMRLLYSAQNPIIQTGRHAVSIDERRCYYQDNLWGDALPMEETPTLVEKVTHADGSVTTTPIQQDILQVWFAGVHSDVGGSYRQVESALPNKTLRWMLDEAKAHGLLVEPDRERMIFGLPPVSEHPKVYAAAGLYPTPPEPGIVHHSLEKAWWLLEVLPHRYYVMDCDEEKWRIPFGASRTLPSGAVVHPSVVERMHLAEAGYAPRNLPLEHLKAHPGSQEGTKADLRGFYRYEPDQTRQAVAAAALKAGAKVMASAVVLLSTVAVMLRGRSS
jgi:uncharacterized protein (DUF2235 family)